jgi:hypothetical protein
VEDDKGGVVAYRFEEGRRASDAGPKKRRKGGPPRWRNWVAGREGERAREKMWAG